MSQLLVITFAQRDTAGQAAERLKSAEGGGGVHLRDVAVVEKDADGKVHVHHGVDKATAGGVFAGGFLGLLIGAVFFPIAGLAIGAALGGLVGRSLGQNVDSRLVSDVTADLTADSSALFVLGEGNLAAVAGALEPFSGKVYQTTLDPEAEAQVQAALDRESGQSG